MSNLSVCTTTTPDYISMPQSGQTADESEQRMIKDILQLVARLTNTMNSQVTSNNVGKGSGGGMPTTPQTSDFMRAGASSFGSGSPPSSNVGGTANAAVVTPSVAGANGGISTAAASAVPASGSSPAAGPVPVQTSAPSTDSPDSSGLEGLSAAPQTQALTQAQGQQVAGQYVTNLMHDFNLTQPQAQGIVANLWHESGGMNSGINQGGAIGQPSGNMADDNANGYGIAQWGGSRKQGLIDYANENGLDPSSQAANYGYLKQELETTESGAITAVKSTSSAQDATAAFCNAFEQPSDPEMASRLADLSLVQSA